MHVDGFVDKHWADHGDRAGRSGKQFPARIKELPPANVASSCAASAYTTERMPAHYILPGACA
jgi:hypothetical protein